MIERDLLQYLQADATLVGYLGGVGQICAIQPGEKIKMPYLLIEPIGGPREKIAPAVMEEINTVRISADYGPAQKLIGRNAIERAKYLIENYRGDMNGASDLQISCKAIASWAGLLGCTRAQFSAVCRFTEVYVERP